MLSVIPVILRCAGILLLFLLALVLLLILLLLFVPVRYSGRGIYETSPEAQVRVSWLLKLVSVRLDYKNGIDAEARLAFLKLWSMKTAPEENAEDTAGTEYTDEELAEALEQEESSPDAAEGSHAEPAAGTHGESAAETHGEPAAETQELPAAEFHEEAVPDEEAAGPAPLKKKKKYTGTPETIDEKFEKIMDKVYGVKDRIDEGIAFLNEESTRRLILLLKKKLFRLLKEICPRDYGGEVRFGFSDPFTTGQAASAAAVLYPVYQDRIHVEPRFDREEIFADLSLKGHIRLFPFAAAAAQIWFNRDFQTVFKRLKNRKKDDGGKHG
jgi:hypothetical protein